MRLCVIQFGWSSKAGRKITVMGFTRVADHLMKRMLTDMELSDYAAYSLSDPSQARRKHLDAKFTLTWSLWTRTATDLPRKLTPSPCSAGTIDGSSTVHRVQRCKLLCTYYQRKINRRSAVAAVGSLSCGRHLNVKVRPNGLDHNLCSLPRNQQRLQIDVSHYRQSQSAVPQRTHSKHCLEQYHMSTVFKNVYIIMRQNI